MTSEYYRKLDAVAQSRYLEKLKLLGLEEKDDPYEASNSCNFIDDMTKWPSVEYRAVALTSQVAILMLSGFTVIAWLGK